MKWALIAFASSAARLLHHCGRHRLGDDSLHCHRDPAAQAVTASSHSVLSSRLHLLIRGRMSQEGRWKFISAGALTLGYAIVGAFLIFYVLAGARALLGEGVGWAVAIGLFWPICCCCCGTGAEISDA